MSNHENKPVLLVCQECACIRGTRLKDRYSCSGKMFVSCDICQEYNTQIYKYHITYYEKPELLSTLDSMGAHCCCPDCGSEDWEYRECHPYCIICKKPIDVVWINEYRQNKLSEKMMKATASNDQLQHQDEGDSAVSVIWKTSIDISGSNIPLELIEQLPEEIHVLLTTGDYAKIAGYGDVHNGRVVFRTVECNGDEPDGYKVAITLDAPDPSLNSKLIPKPINNKSVFACYCNISTPPKGVPADEICANTQAWLRQEDVDLLLASTQPHRNLEYPDPEQFKQEYECTFDGTSKPVSDPTAIYKEFIDLGEGGVSFEVSIPVVHTSMLFVDVVEKYGSENFTERDNTLVSVDTVAELEKMLEVGKNIAVGAALALRNHPQAKESELKHLQPAERILWDIASKHTVRVEGLEPEFTGEDGQQKVIPLGSVRQLIAEFMYVVTGGAARDKAIRDTQQDQKGFESDPNLIGSFIDKKCPDCGATLLGNKNGDEWCSFVECTYGLQDRFWWGYLHIDGSVIVGEWGHPVERFDIEIEGKMYMKTIVKPLAAKSYEEACAKIKEEIEKSNE